MTSGTGRTRSGETRDKGGSFRGGERLQDNEAGGFRGSGKDGR